MTASEWGKLITIYMQCLVQFDSNKLQIIMIQLKITNRSCLCTTAAQTQYAASKTVTENKEHSKKISAQNAALNTGATIEDVTTGLFIFRIKLIIRM